MSGWDSGERTRCASSCRSIPKVPRRGGSRTALRCPPTSQTASGVPAEDGGEPAAGTTAHEVVEGLRLRGGGDVGDEVVDPQAAGADQLQDGLAVRRLCKRI